VRLARNVATIFARRARLFGQRCDHQADRSRIRLDACGVQIELKENLNPRQVEER